MLREYHSPRPLRSLIELLITAVPLALFWALAWITLDAGHWWGFLFTVPAAAFLVRLFILQHDCGHGALFHSRRANDVVGRMIGVLTLAPYDFWRHTHAHHLASRIPSYRLPEVLRDHSQLRGISRYGSLGRVPGPFLLRSETAWFSPAGITPDWSEATGFARSSSLRTVPSRTAWSSG